MARVNDVANFFIMLANHDKDDQITNLKLNKLMYYAQGVHLARTGEPLFDELIEAWTFGPVIPSIYSKYKVYGKNSIFFDKENESVSADDFSEEELDTLLDVIHEFGKYTGSTLITLTHEKGTPWSDAIEQGEKTISKNSMEKFFLQNPVPTFQPDNKECVTVLPHDWYDPDEDREWEAYG